MNSRNHWSRILTTVGGIGMVIGAIDPLEGSVVVLASSGLVTLGTFLSEVHRRSLHYWIRVLLLIMIGVGALFLLSAFGGIGGSSGHSMWWGVLILPYPIGWILGIVNLLFRLIGSKGHCHAST